MNVNITADALSFPLPVYGERVVQAQRGPGEGQTHASAPHPARMSLRSILATLSPQAGRGKGDA